MCYLKSKGLENINLADGTTSLLHQPWIYAWLVEGVSAGQHTHDIRGAIALNTHCAYVAFGSYVFSTVDGLQRHFTDGFLGRPHQPPRQSLLGVGISTPLHIIKHQPRQRNDHQHHKRHRQEKHRGFVDGVAVVPHVMGVADGNGDVYVSVVVEHTR